MCQNKADQRRAKLPQTESRPFSSVKYMIYWPIFSANCKTIFLNFRRLASQFLFFVNFL